MGHGEDPSQREQTECASVGDTGEGVDVLFYLSHLFVLFRSYNEIKCKNQCLYFR